MFKRPEDHEILAAYELCSNQREAAKYLGISQAVFNKYYHQIKNGVSPEQQRGYEMQEIPDEDISIDEILEHKKRVFQKKKNYRDETKYIDITLKSNKPIGVSFFGDPHIDDDGCDIEGLIHDLELCEKTDGLHAINIGDVTNNWVGRLEKLHNKQSVTLAQTYKLTEWFMGKNIWLAHCLGNHDHWNNGKYLLKSLMKKSGCSILEDDVRLRLNFPNGKQVTIHARHDFKGNSQWNTAHGVSKSAQMGNSENILVNGHTHVSGYQLVKSPNGTVSHCIQLSAYKIYDSFADEMGFRDQAIFNNAVTIINPKRKDPVMTFFDLKEGAKYLAYLRA